MSTAISQVFEQTRTRRQLAFMPFIAAGDPDLAATPRVLTTLAQAGVDLIEVGFPYSDPIADGPVIQAAYTRALAHHVTVPGIFDAVRGWRATQPKPPLIAMVSFALLYRRGPDWFVRQSAESGFSGLIVPDLPGDEAAELFALVHAQGLDLIQLVAPTTPRERVRQILASCSGFVYCVAVAGTTGERDRVRDELLDQLRWLRDETALPLAVGFGISQPHHVEPLRGLADGVIVGSALVRHLEASVTGGRPLEDALVEIQRHAQQMVAACRHG
jgi:tryptophan synthase alpha chain